jgi:uncharacterized protein YlxP (DUF503 family)
MANLDELFAALQKADAAGNTEDAKQLAGIIRQQQGAVTAPEKPADTRRPEDVGFLEGLGAATKKGFEGLGDIASGLGLAGTSVLGSKEDTAKKMAAIKADQEAQARGTPTLTASDIQRIAEERGLVKAGTQVPAYIAEQILQSAPQMALPLAVGAAASPFLTPVGGAIAGIATYGIQQFGNFLVRQAQAKDDPEELDLAKAAMTAAGTAPIGYFADKFTVGLGGVGSKKAISEIYAELGKRGVMKEVGKRAAKGAGVGIIAEAPTEVLEQAAERWQAGLDLTDDEAKNEYKEAFFGAAAAGAGIGAGAKGIGAYGEYRQARKAEDALGQVRSEKTAFDEAGEFDADTGVDTGVNQQGVPIFDQQELDIAAGVRDAGPGDLEGNQLPPSPIGEREVAINNQLAELTNEQAKIAAFDDADPRIQEIEDVKRELSVELETLQQQAAPTQTFNAPGQQGGFEFGAADETTQRAIDTDMTETPGFALAQETGAAALPKTEVTPIEEAPETPKAKMMLIGEGANPLAPVKSFLNSVKAASVAPMELKKFKAELNNLIGDISEFVGQSTKDVARFRARDEEGNYIAPPPVPPTGPDVSVPLDPQQRAMRLNFLDNFFNQFSAVGPDKEAATSALSQRMAGMDAVTQANVLSQLTSLPAINTRRGVEELRAKFNEAIAKFEGEQIQEPVEKAAIVKEDKQADTLAKRAITLLKNIPDRLRTPEEKAAAVYFGRWNFSMALRSAAFDLGSKPNELFTGPVFKGQNKSQAELLQKWVEENLSEADVASFNATIEDYKQQTVKAEAFEKKAEGMEKMGGAARRYGQIAGRAPTGKVSEGFKKEAGLDKYKKPSKVSKLEASRFYPMHPAMQQAISEGNLDAALSILEQSGNQFHAGLASKLRSLGLQTTVVFDRQNSLASQLINNKYGTQQNDIFKFVQATNPTLFNDYFRDTNNFKKVKQGLDKLTDPAIEGQVEQLKAAYDFAMDMSQASGTYMVGLDVINLNRAQGGASNYTFIHELVHAATLYSLNETNFDSLNSKQQAAVRELNRLYEFAKTTELNEYGFENLEEFVAEAFSNEAFQDILERIPYQGKTDQSLWDKFTQLVARLFGMDNVLGYTLANANIIMRAPPALTAQAAAYNAKGKRSILAGKLAVAPGPMQFADKIFKDRPTWEQMKLSMPGFLEDLNDSVRKYYLGAFTLRQLNDMIGHRVPQFRRFLDTTEKMLDERNRILEATKDITDSWMRFQTKDPEKARKMNLLMLDATLQGKDPAKGKTGIKELDAAWDEIGPEGHKIYKQVRDFYRARLDDYIGTNLENKKASLLGRGFSQADIDAHPSITRVLRNVPFDQHAAYLQAQGYTDGEITAHFELAAVENFFKKHNIEPYFPVRRFGRFSLQLGTGKDKEFYLFETAKERRLFAAKRVAEMKAEGKMITDDDVIERNSIKDLTQDSRSMKEFTFLQELREIIKNEQGTTIADLKNNLDESLEQLYFLTLPDQSVRKMFMNRKGTAGMDTDMLRAFTTSAFHMAYQHSRYKFSRELYGAIDSAEQSLAGRAGKEAKVNGEYLGELKNRLGYIMNPTDTGTIPSFLSNLSFIWYMTAPASALVNMLGVPAIGVPVVAARYGWGKTSAKMGEYAKKFASTGIKNEQGEYDFPTLDRYNLTPAQRKAYEQLVADGVIDITLSHDLVGMTEAPTNMYTGRSQRAMKILSGAFHGAEKFNREVVAMATFDLAYEKAKASGYTDDAAFKKAIGASKELTYKSMFDYSTLNKPRYFQNEYAKVILQFKQFSQQMTYLLARSVYEAAYKKYSDAELQDIRLEIIGDHKVNKPDLPALTDKEVDAAVQDYIKGVRSEAIKRLGGTLGMTAMFAGVTGLPLWSVVAGTMNALQAVFGEDEEEYDFNNWFKNWASETFGGFFGDSISRGVASQVLGGDLASRMGLNDLWFRDTRQSSDEVTALQNTLINLLGPTAGLLITSAETVKQYNDGHLQRAMETASPAFLKNFMKGARYATEGRAVNLKGDELVGDVSGYESLIQGFGFSPERVAQRQKSNIEMKGMEQKILNRRTDLMNAFFMGVDNDDDDMIDRVLDKVEKFNAANPEVAITGDNLTRSVQSRFKNRALAEMTGGISINKKLMPKLEDMGGYGSPD